MKTPPPVPSVVTCEDKMETLIAFIRAALLAPHAANGVVVTMLARSAASPVARALVALGPDLVSRGHTVRAIFGTVETKPNAACWTVISPAIAFARDLRWTRNPRLNDAHEQLVLTPEACWVGDCLRRDPVRRDAYEHAMTSNAAVSRILRISFERLWAVSEPVAVRAASGLCPSGLAGGTPGKVVLALPPRDGSSGPLVSSAH